MKSIKKSALCFVIFLCCINIGLTQNNIDNLSETQKMEMKKTMKDFMVSLQLTEEQEPKFIAISKKYGQQTLKLKESNASKFSKYRTFKSINSSRNKEMKKLLTKTQYKSYVKKQEQLQKDLKEKG